MYVNYTQKSVKTDQNPCHIDFVCMFQQSLEQVMYLNYHAYVILCLCMDDVKRQDPCFVFALAYLLCMSCTYMAEAEVVV